MLLVHKIKLNPNKAQAVCFAKACGVARHAYSWALAEWKSQYEAGQKPCEAALRRRYSAIKPVEFPWALEATKCAPQQALPWQRETKRDEAGRKAEIFEKIINISERRKAMKFPKIPRIAKLIAVTAAISTVLAYVIAYLTA